MRAILMLAFLQYSECNLYTMRVLWNAVKLSRRHRHESYTHTGHYSEQVSSTPHTRNLLHGGIFNIIFFSVWLHNSIFP